MMRAIDPLAGSQNANVVIRHIVIVMIMLLNLPIRSATSPGKYRPKQDPTFKMAMIWYENAVDIPWLKA
jgi:hypothetical protein